MEKKNLLKFIFIEIISILLFSLSYRICIKFLSSYLVVIISLIASLLFDYVCLTKFIYINYHKSKYDLLKFVIAGILSIFLMKFISNVVLYRFLLLQSLVAKGFSLVIVLIYCYIVKNYIFNGFKIKNWREPFIIINEYWKKFINYKYIKPVFKFLPNNILLFIYLFVTILFGVRFFNTFDDVTLYRQGDTSANIGEFINATHTISFSNIDKLANNPDKICIVFGTYSRQNDSNLIFNLYKGDKKVYTKTINTVILNDGRNYCLDVPEIDKDEINDYVLDVVSSNADNNNNITIFMSGETKEEAISLVKDHDLISYKYIIIGLFILFFLLICYFINKKGNKISPEKMLLVFMIYILSELFIMPPLQVPDEAFHLVQSFSLSQHWFDADEKTEISVPSSIECLNYSHVVKYNKVMSADDVTQCLKEADKNVNRGDLFGMKPNNRSTFFGHLPPAAALKLVDIFSNSPLLIFYLSRLGAFIVSFTILFFAIKMTPKYKNIMLLIGVLPMFIQQMNSFSYDSILNSVVMLYYAFILKKIYSDREVTFKDLLIPIISLLIVYTLKMVYIFLFVLLFFIPKKKFKSFNKKILFIFIVAAAIFLGVFVLQKILFISGGTFDANSHRQIEYVLHNPLSLFTIAFNTLKIRTWFYLQGTVGYFGWWAFALDDFAIYLWFIMFVLVCLNEKSIFTENKGKKFNYKKFILLITVLLMIAAVFASMYFCWSEYKLYFVDGVQGRYFIPILFAIALLIIPKESKSLRITNKNVYMYCNILLVQYILYLIIFFY